MEPAKAKMKIFLGEFPVVNHTLTKLTIDLGNNVTITMHVAGLPLLIQNGTMLPLFTYVPYNTEPFDALYVPPSE